MPVTRMRKNSRNRRSVKRQRYSRNRKLYRSQKMQVGGKKKKSKGSRKQKRKPKRKGSKKNKEERVGTMKSVVSSLDNTQEYGLISGRFANLDLFYRFRVSINDGKFIYESGEVDVEDTPNMEGSKPKMDSIITHLNGKKIKIIQSDSFRNSTDETIFVIKNSSNSYGIKFLKDFIGVDLAEQITKIRYIPAPELNPKLPNTTNPFKLRSSSEVSEGLPTTAPPSIPLTGPPASNSDSSSNLAPLNAPPPTPGSRLYGSNQENKDRSLAQKLAQELARKQALTNSRAKAQKALATLNADESPSMALASENQQELNPDIFKRKKNTYNILLEEPVIYESKQEIINALDNLSENLSSFTQREAIIKLIKILSDIRNTSPYLNDYQKELFRKKLRYLSDEHVNTSISHQIRLIKMNLNATPPPKKSKKKMPKKSSGQSRKSTNVCSPSHAASDEKYIGIDDKLCCRRIMDNGKAVYKLVAGERTTKQGTQKIGCKRQAGKTPNLNL